MYNLEQKTKNMSISDAAVEVFSRFNTMDNVYTVDMILRKTIVISSYAFDPVGNEEKILGFYEESRKEARAGIPLLTDVLSYIYAYNSDLFYNAALVDFLENGDFVGRGEGEIQDILEERSLSFEEMYSYNMEYYSLDRFVCELLSSNHLSFIISEDENIYDDMNAYKIVETLPAKGKGYSVVANDCQNVLICEFSILGYFLHEDNILHLPGVLDNARNY